MRFGAIVQNPNSETVTASFFGTVVKSGENPVTVGSGQGVGSTNYGMTLVGDTETTRALEALQIGSIRYPGGTESRLFDISDPQDLAGLQRALEYCAANNLALNFTLNDTPYIAADGQTVRAGGQALATFITQNLIAAAQELGVTIESIHIGNEFAGRTAVYGSPAFVGYAKVAASLVNELDAILDGLPVGTARPDLVIQPPNWAAAGQQRVFFDILKSTIGADGLSSASKIDAVDLHGLGNETLRTATNTLNLTWDAYFGVDAPSYETNLARIMAYWQNDPAMNHVAFRNDAWAYAEGASLSQAALGMLQIHTASKLGFVSMTNYVGYNVDPAALIAARPGEDLIRPGGALFAMMSEALQGTQAITLADAPSLGAEQSAESLTRAFAGGDRVVLYLVNRRSTDLGVDLMVQPLLGALEAFIGGVARSDVDILGSTNPTLNNGRVTHEFQTLTRAQLGQSGVDFTLNGYEIAQVNIQAAGSFGTYGNDQMRGGAGVDVLHGEAGDDRLNGAGGADLLAGGAGKDHLFGGQGNDILFGGAGEDMLDGGAGNDLAIYRFAPGAVTANLTQPAGNTNDAQGDRYVGIENLEGSQFADRLTGDAGANTLMGGLGNDTLRGNAGMDRLIGGAGADVLSGGAGRDEFVFDTPTGDRILDFNADALLCSSIGFGNLATGVLQAQFFRLNTAADSNDYFIFRTSDKTLWFDADGSGVGGAVLVADLQNDARNITAADIWIV